MSRGNGAGDALSLFSGIGGLDLGAHIAGFSIRAAVDADEDALACFSAALGALTIAGKIEDLEAESVIRTSGLSSNSEALLISGPPCTGFSHAGFWIEGKRKGKDGQVNRIADFLTYLERLRPRAFLLENVPGLLFRNYEHIFEGFIKRVNGLGYATSYEILNAADYGVPQARRRLFVVGIRGSHEFRFPAPTFGQGEHRSSGWAIASLPESDNPPEDDEILRGKYAHLLPLVPPGDNYLYFTARRGYPEPIFGWRKKYWSFLLKLHPDRPSPTIPARRISNNGPFHWDNRRLRIREIARLQGFPDNYPLAARKKARVHLGNAVPPMLAAQLFWELRVFLGEARASERPQALEHALARDASAADVSSALGSFIAQRLRM